MNSYSHSSHYFPQTITNVSFMLLCCKKESQKAQIYILTHVLPMYMSSKDPFLISFVFQMLDSLPNGPMKVCIYYHLWKSYPRCWNRLRSLLGEIMQTWKVSLIKDIEMETCFTRMIK